MRDRWQRMRDEHRRLVEEHVKEQLGEQLGERFREHLHAHGRFHRRGRFRGAPLHVRLFWWFGFSILLMGAAAWGVFVAFGVGRPGATDETRLRDFAASRFARVWHDEAARSELAHAVARTVDGSRLTLEDASGRALLSTGAPGTSDQNRRVGPPDFTMRVVEN